MVGIPYTAFPAHRAVRQGVPKFGSLTEMLPPHSVTQDKFSAKCVGPFLLTPNDNHRTNDNIIARSAILLDIDSEVRDLSHFADLELEVERVADRLMAAGLEFLLCSSHSHGRPKENPPLPYFGFRLAIPFAEPLSLANSANIAVDYGRLARVVTDRYALPGTLFGLSQPWFVPTWDGNAAPGEPIYFFHEGVGLDWQKLDFRRALARPTPSPDDYTSPPSNEALSIRVSDYLANRATDTEKLALRFINQNRVPTKEEIKSKHEQVVMVATRVVAKCMADGEDVEELLTFFERWAETMQDALPRAGSGWLGEIKRALEGAVAKVPQWRAEGRQRDAEQLERLTKKWAEGRNK